MKTKHTQWPWKIQSLPHEREFRKGENYAIRDSRGCALAQVGHIDAIHDGDETKANARLIAAAPELLYALKWALENLGDDLDPDFQTAKTHCEMIVKKAEGESGEN